MSSVVAKVVELYEQQSLSIPQTAAELGIPISRARKMLLLSGVMLRSRGDGIRLRGPDLSEMRKGKKRQPFSSEHRQNLSAARLAWGDVHAVGVSTLAKGYEVFTRGPHKGRLVHVVIMERRIGRRLKSDECVHHIDGNGLNNDDNNLALMTRSGHTRLHRRERDRK